MNKKDFEKTFFSVKWARHVSLSDKSYFIAIETNMSRHRNTG